MSTTPPPTPSHPYRSTPSPWLSTQAAYTWFKATSNEQDFHTSVLPYFCELAPLSHKKSRWDVSCRENPGNKESRPQCHPSAWLPVGLQVANYPNYAPAFHPFLERAAK